MYFFFLLAKYRGPNEFVLPCGVESIAISKGKCGENVGISILLFTKSSSDEFFSPCGWSL